MGCGHGRRSGEGRRRRSETYGYPPSDTTSKATLVIPRVPEKCSNCGALMESEDVKWTGPATIECPYCGCQLEVELEKIE